MLFSDAYVNKSSKHSSYFPVYDKIFRNINRMLPMKILEIGVDRGDGLSALKTYFPNSLIVGLDIKPECKIYTQENIEVIIGSQVDKQTIDKLKTYEFDIIIDDGSHHNEHVFHTFCNLFPSLKKGVETGLYIVEDIHTSYWPYYGGGLKHPNSTIEKFKSLIDMQNAWCVRDAIACHTPPYPGMNVPKTYFEVWVETIQFIENIIVVKKREFEASCSKPI